MSSSLRWRIVLVVVVALFALALVWPTIRWATLSDQPTESITLGGVTIDNLSPKQILSLHYYRWEGELEDDLEYLRKPGKRTPIEEERTTRHETLQQDIDKLAASESFQKLPPFEQAKQIIKLENRARTPHKASLGRNIRRDLARWWAGDEAKILHLGLDLKGGIYMVIETDPDNIKEVLEKLKNRIDEFGVADPLVQQQGSKRIIIQLPGATDLEKAERLIKERAVMEWMLVEEETLSNPEWNKDVLLDLYDSTVRDLPDNGPDPAKPDTITIYKDEDGNLVNFTVLDETLREDGAIPPNMKLRVYEDENALGEVTRTPLLLRSSEDNPYIVSGDELRGASCTVTPGPYGEPYVKFEIAKSDAVRRFKDITATYSAKSDNAITEGRSTRGWRLAILLDNKVISAPAIKQALGDSGVITGSKTLDEANMLSLQLRTGSLPAEIRVVQNIQVGPSLGADSIRMGWRAALIGLIVVVIFMGIYYRVSGSFAVVALAINLILLLGVLAAAGATLTLPGIAGIVLTIGMAVDANVLIFERIREELKAAKKIKAAVEAGYNKALRTILDANITTLITAAVLFFLGTGPVRGFAVTLSIGICTSVFSAIVVTRVLFDLLLLRKSVETVKMFQFFKQPSINFIDRRTLAMGISAVLIVLGLVAFTGDFKSNWGVDFTGGTVYRLDFEQPVDVGAVRQALPGGLDTEARVQAFDVQPGTPTGMADKVMITARGTPEDDTRLKNLPTQVADTIGATLSDESVESVSGSVSKDLARQTLVAFALALLGITIYVSWRFEFKFAIGAIVALLHDVLITVGFFAGFFILGRRQINAPTIAAFLTIVGYSLNDTIVVFDRIREDLKIMKRLDFKTIINTSINQTLSRTTLTSLTTMIVVVSLYVLGGQAINDFSFAMLIGIIVGTYSSIFIASPVLLYMQRKKEAAASS